MVNEGSDPDYVSVNAQYWNDDATNWVALGEQGWSAPSPTWGQWRVAESEIQMLPADMAGMDAVELGCGTAYVSAWMARKGARCVGIDVSHEQLTTARRLRAEHALEIELLLGNAEAVPRPSESFDFAVSEYGAALWADPQRWVPEARRLLRPGGRLAFLTTHPMAPICMPSNGAPATHSLHRPYFGMRYFDWRDVEIEPGGIEFNLTISDWFSLFDDTGFEVEAFIELQCPTDSEKVSFAIPQAWAHRYPSEMVWKLRRR